MSSRKPFNFSTTLPAGSMLDAAPPHPATNTVAERLVAVIGTAGRDKSRPMSLSLWQAMCADLQSRVFSTDHLVSGGAAWADHLAVHAFYAGWVKKLTLFLPAPLSEQGFHGPSKSAASAANYYHELFSKVIGLDTRKQLHGLVNREGVVLHAEPIAHGYSAMFARNAKVAALANNVLAYTFAQDPLKPADGGTLNTWAQIVARADAGECLSINLGAMIKHEPTQQEPSTDQTQGGTHAPSVRFSFARQR